MIMETTYRKPPIRILTEKIVDIIFGRLEKSKGLAANSIFQSAFAMVLNTLDMTPKINNFKKLTISTSLI